MDDGYICNRNHICVSLPVELRKRILVLDVWPFSSTCTYEVLGPDMR